jgi:hypothetical protein
VSGADGVAVAAPAAAVSPMPAARSAAAAIPAAVSLAVHRAVALPISCLALCMLVVSLFAGRPPAAAARVGFPCRLGCCRAGVRNGPRNEERDSAAFEAHLMGCESCRAEFAELSPLGALLTGMAPVEDPADTRAEPPAIDLLRRRAAASRRRARWQAALGAAACAAALAGGVAVGIAVAPGHVQRVTVPPGVTGERHTATGPSTRVTGTVGLVAKAWGTQITLDLSNVHGPLDCQLVAVSKTGERRVVTGWFVPVPGDGVPGHPAHLLVQGGTAIPKASLSRLEVIVVNGATLLNIPA